MPMDPTQLTRWRLILGKSAEEPLQAMAGGQPLLGGDQSELDEALEAIYAGDEIERNEWERPSDGGPHGSVKGRTMPRVAKWLDQIRTFFPKDIVVLLQKDAIELQEKLVTAERAGLAWHETNYLALRRGPYRIGAGLEEAPEDQPAKVLHGRYVNLFDPDLKVQRSVALDPGSHVFLLDLDAPAAPGVRVLAASGKILPGAPAGTAVTWTVEGINHTPGIVLLSAPQAPKSVTLEGRKLDTFAYDATEHLIHIRFPNESRPRELTVEF